MTVPTIVMEGNFVGVVVGDSVCGLFETVLGMKVGKKLAIEPSSASTDGEFEARRLVGKFVSTMEGNELGFGLVTRKVGNTVGGYVSIGTIVGGVVGEFVWHGSSFASHDRPIAPK
mmetsp:Transcript_49950/g.60089  ORF Transcript_49950/g.60089 Transcript_49950/m.60089 type:complete len:116 (-) Transcript_49950:394-741(-)